MLISQCGSYRVTLTFGLHLGSSIEGAIGSEFKFDASYLSSHVNLAHQLESLCMFYGVLILMSESLVRSCSSKGIQLYFRALDRVHMTGTKAPTRIFTVDMDTEAVTLPPGQLPRKPGSKGASQARLKNRTIKKQRLEDNYEPLYVFSTDKHIQRLRSIFHLDFFQKFERGYLNYEAGEWDVAAQILRQTRLMLRHRSELYNFIDGPSCAIMEYMHRFDFKAPADWPGFRRDEEVFAMPPVRVLESSIIASPGTRSTLTQRQMADGFQRQISADSQVSASYSGLRSI